MVFWAKVWVQLGRVHASRLSRGQRDQGEQGGKSIITDRPVPYPDPWGVVGAGHFSPGAILAM